MKEGKKEKEVLTRKCKKRELSTGFVILRTEVKADATEEREKLSTISIKLVVDNFSIDDQRGKKGVCYCIKNKRLRTKAVIKNKREHKQKAPV